MDGPNGNLAPPGTERLRVVHVLNGVATRADGPSVSALRICAMLDAMGAQVTIAALEGPGSAAAQGFARTFPPSPLLKPVGSSPAVRGWLESQVTAGQAPVLHSHGLWRMPGVYASGAASRSGARLIVSPHGALAARSLSIRRYRKKAFWTLLQRAALQAATCFHATCEAEYDDIRRAGFDQPICLLPHGVDLPEPHAPDRGRRRLLFLGRVHPQKGVETLLRAWKAVQASFGEWDLEIVGRDEGDSFARLATRMGTERIFFRGPLYGRDKEVAFQEADLFVLPSESENFGLAVAESLAAATPVIVTRGTPWAAVEAHAAGWWIEPGAESLAATLRQALSRTRAELAAMGGNGREWMRVEFVWENIGRQWAQTYGWLARPDLASPPHWVRMEKRAG